ncbi:MAG: RNB domain-containing ribonuclease [Candidatus Peribacteria bacterium]|jgi:exoribonuclease R|nr:RNB domain-containing ribonuclease [Candidatus Peribacteria bacterium]
MLDFDFKETRIKFDDKKVIAIEEYPKYESNKLIEAFMVSAYEAVAKEFYNIPFLYRIHEKTKEEDIL